MSAIDLTAFSNAVQRLDEGLARHRAAPDDDQLRDGLIQRRAVGERAASAEGLDAMAAPTLIRTAGEQGLLRGEWATWKRCRDQRNITSHTCDEAKAIALLPVVPGFLDDVRDLSARLRATG